MKKTWGTSDVVQFFVTGPQMLQQSPAISIVFVARTSLSSLC